MASLQLKGDSWYFQFLYRGKRHTFTIGKVSDIEAEAVRAKVGYLLMRLKQRLLAVPVGMDVVTFVQCDGNPPIDGPPPTRHELTLVGLRDAYLRTHKNGTLEQSTIDGIEQHFHHWVSTLGERFPIQATALADLQRHVDRRAKMKGIRGSLSPATIKKEIVTLRTAWNWGVQFGLVSGKFPNRGLRYPKAEEKPPFMTWQEIERQIAAGSDPEQLWESLYLTLPEIEDLLAYARVHATMPWVHPMLAFAAHTGARRSELLRAKPLDIDFASSMATVREKKRVRGQRTTRRVPLTASLREVLEVSWVLWTVELLTFEIARTPTGSSSPATNDAASCRSIPDSRGSPQKPPAGSRTPPFPVRS